MHRRVVLALGLLLCVPAIAQAASSIVVGNHVLLPNTAGQTINLNVTGNDNIAALDLFMSINGGSGPAPIVTAVNIIGPGTIFGSVANSGLSLFGGTSNPPSLTPAVATTTASGTVVSNGLLAVVTFDTTGVPAGVYSWSLTGHPEFGPTDFGTELTFPFDFIFPEVTNGTLTIVPEPASVVMGLFAAAGVGVVAIRKRRARRA